MNNPGPRGNGAPQVAGRKLQCLELTWALMEHLPVLQGLFLVCTNTLASSSAGGMCACLGVTHVAGDVVPDSQSHPCGWCQGEA